MVKTNKKDANEKSINELLSAAAAEITQAEDTLRKAMNTAVEQELESVVRTVGLAMWQIHRTMLTINEARSAAED